MSFISDNESYAYHLNRLTEAQKLKLNERECLIGRKLQPWEITTIFKLTPYNEERQPRKRRMSDEVEQSWLDQ